MSVDPVNSSATFPVDCDESTVFTMTPAMYLHGWRIEEAIRSLAGHGYEHGSVMLGINGYGVILTPTDTHTIPLRLSPFSRHVFVEMLIGAVLDRDITVTVNAGAVTETVAFVGDNLDSHEGLEFIPVTLRDVGNGGAESHNRTADSGQNIVITNTSASNIVLFAVSWRELHNDLLEIEPP